MGARRSNAGSRQVDALPRDARVMLAATFFYLASVMLVNPLIAGFTGTFGAGAVVMGVVGGLMNVCSLVMRPVAGNLADRLRKRRLATAGAVVLSVSTLLYGAADSAEQVAVLRLVSGAGYSFCSVCMASWFASLLPPGRIGSGMGMFGMMNALGMAVGPALGMAVYHAAGYRPALVAAGMLAVVSVVLIQMVRSPGDPDVPAADSKGRGGRPRRLQVLDRRVVAPAAIVALFTVPYVACQSFLVSYVEARGIDVAVSLFFTVYALVLLGLRYVLKRLFDTVPFGRFLAASSVCALGALGLLAVLANDIELFAAAACMAGGYGIMCSVCQSAAVRIAGPEHTGLANSTYYMGLDIGMAVGPTVAGALFDVIDLTWFFPVFAVTVPLALAVYATAPRLRSC